MLVQFKLLSFNAILRHSTASGQAATDLNAASTTICHRLRWSTAEAAGNQCYIGRYLKFQLGFDRSDRLQERPELPEYSVDERQLWALATLCAASASVASFSQVGQALEAKAVPVECQSVYPASARICFVMLT